MLPYVGEFTKANQDVWLRLRSSDSYIYIYNYSDGHTRFHFDVLDLCVHRRPILLVCSGFIQLIVRKDKQKKIFFLIYLFFYLIYPTFWNFLGRINGEPTHFFKSPVMNPGGISEICINVFAKWEDFYVHQVPRPRRSNIHRLSNNPNNV